VRAGPGGGVKYVVQVGDERVEVTLTPEGVVVLGDVLEAHLSDVEGTPVRQVRVGTAVHRVVSRPHPSRGRYTLSIDGYRYEVEALDERTRAIRDLSVSVAAPVGPAPLVAPMPGLIVRVNVQPGDAVQPGQGLVVMEAMKMENELRASASGTVKRVAAEPGTAVEKGALLVELQ
jgi:biotin carboxyl carrier protein